MTLHEFWLNWQKDALEWLRHDAPKILGVLVVAFILLRLLRLGTRRLTVYSHREALPSGMRARQLRTLAEVINSVGLALIVFLTAMQVLRVVGIDMGPLLASAGIAGLAIGFGAQTLVKDVINGFFILMENQYDLGDMISISGVKGTVEAMTLRRTVLRDPDGSVHVIPNSEIKIVSNLTRDWSQVALHVAIAYNEPSDRVIEILQEVGREIRNDPDFAAAIVADPEVPGIERVGNGEVDYLMQLKTRPADRDRVSRELRRRIKAGLEKNNIQAARPSQVFVADAAPPGAPR
jgi:moderate conductance mechanosensitive channel